MLLVSMTQTIRNFFIEVGPCRVSRNSADTQDVSTQKHRWATWSTTPRRAANQRLYDMALFTCVKISYWLFLNFVKSRSERFDGLPDSAGNVYISFPKAWSTGLVLIFSNWVYIQMPSPISLLQANEGSFVNLNLTIMRNSSISLVIITSPFHI